VKTRSLLLLTVATLLLACAVPAAAQILYENGPINGETDAWTINFGFELSDSFQISTGNSQATGFSFGAWLTPGDVLQSVEVTLSSQPLQTGTVYFDGVINLTQSGCFLNNYSYDVCTETGSFTPTTLGNGEYWVTLGNAVVNDGNPVYWDENSGVDCHSPGCPSEAKSSLTGSDPSEAFSILGTTSGTGSTVPEPASLLLFGTGVIGGLGLLRRKLR